MNSTGCTAHMHRLAGVLLHVSALDLHSDDLTVVEHDVEVAVRGDWLVVLGGLEVLRLVRVEVVLPRETSPRGDRAVQRETDTHGGLHRCGVEIGRASCRE